MRPTLTAMRGFPGSGKSTLARQIAKETGAVVVCRDDLRKMLHDTYHSGKPELENEVTISERAQVTAFLKAGKSVIVDATHLEPKYLRKWAKLAAELGADFNRVDVPTPALDCCARDLLREAKGERAVGRDVIARMAKRNPIVNWPDIQAQPYPAEQPVEWIDGLPEAILVDIDGTLAHMNGRSPYDYTQVATDLPDENVRWLVNTLYYAATNDRVNVIVLSGRDDECREETEEWLWTHGIAHDELVMRPEHAKDADGNKLPDYVVKYDLFNQHVRGKFNVRLVLDDRQQVVNLWRRIGLKCLQVQEGDF